MTAHIKIMQLVAQYLGYTPIPIDALDLPIKSIDVIADTWGMRRRPVLLSERFWTQDHGVLVAYTLKEKTPLLLMPAPGKKTYLLYHPEQDTYTPIDPDMLALCSPYADMFFKPFSHDSLTLWQVIKTGLSGYQKEIKMLAFCGLFIALLNLVLPQAVGFILDKSIPSGQVSMIAFVGVLLLMVSLCQTLLSYVESLLIVRLEFETDLTLQSAVFDRTLSLHPRFFKNYSSGDLMTRVMGIQSVRQALGAQTMRYLVSGVFSLVQLMLLFYYHVSWAFWALLCGFIMFSLTLYLGHQVRQSQETLTQLRGHLLGVVNQMVVAVSKIRVGGAESRVFTYWHRLFLQQNKVRFLLQKSKDQLYLVQSVVTPLSTALLFFVAHGQVSQHQLSTGQFLAFAAAFGGFLSGMHALSHAVLTFYSAQSSFERLSPILQALPEKHPNQRHPGVLSGHIHLEQVSFSYQSSACKTISDVTLTIQAGQSVAFVGPSGSGKSTLLRILLGFESLQSGKIFYDGQDLSGLQIEAVRRQIGVVLQHGKINAGTVFENIAGARALTLEDAWEAVRGAGLESDIQAMPMGLHTGISEGGTNLSGGQRQRLLIARVLALKPKIIFFDEATSALDNHTQAIVSDYLNRMRVTRLLIAHRLSTIRHVDCIYVISQGRVVQSGAYESLLQQPGLFRQLLAQQNMP